MFATAVTLQELFFPVALAVTAAAYAAVGQAGATGYIAVMGLAGYSPEIIRPAALALNTLVAAIGTARFAQAGFITWRGTYPFILLGLPLSVLGGATHIPTSVYYPLVGLLLLVAAWQMFRSAHSATANEGRTPTHPPLAASMLAGGIIGFVAGMTGIGGGIFNAPLMLTFGWLSMRQTAGLSALFNLLNSAAAFAGLWSTSPAFSQDLPWWLAAVAVGAILGAWLGIKHLPPRLLRYLLAALLLTGGLWMLWTL
jgi:uncharacterized membrane protein YfcA